MVSIIHIYKGTDISVLVSDGHPIMATGSATGHVGLWDLEERKLSSQMREAHTTAVTGMKCLPNEPLMVTSAPDNTLKVRLRENGTC